MTLQEARQEALNALDHYIAEQMEQTVSSEELVLAAFDLLPTARNAAITDTLTQLWAFRARARNRIAEATKAELAKLRFLDL